MKQQSQLSDILARLGVLTPAQAEKLHQEHQQWGGRLSALVVKLGFVREDQLVHILSKELRLPLAPLERMRAIPSDALNILAATTCERLNVLPMGVDVIRKRLQLAVSDPTDTEVFHELRASTGLEIEPFVSTTTVIRRSIRINFYGENTAEVLRVIPELSSATDVPRGQAGSSSGGQVRPQASSQQYQTGSRPPILPTSGGSIHAIGHRTPVPLATGASKRTGAHAIVHPPGSDGLFRQGWHPPAPTASHPASLELDAATEVAAMREDASRSAPHASVLASQQAQHAVALATAERQISQLQAELQVLRQQFQQTQQQFQQTQQQSQTELDELQTLLRSRFQEHRALMRGLFDLLVARGYLKKDDLVKMLNDVSMMQQG